MEDEKNVSYLMYESAQARSERINKRLWILSIILIVALVGTNAGWIIYESQYEDVVTTTQTVEQQTDDGGSNYVGDFISGDKYGEAKGDKNGN